MANARPVRRSYASTYFALVRSTTSAGSGGGGDERSQPDSCSSQSRTYCLSYDGCARPGTHSSAGQNRDESGVSTSSPSTSSPAGDRPNSTFVSATITPRTSASDDARAYTASVNRSSSAASVVPTVA